MKTPTHSRIGAGLAALLLASACGGGGGGSASPQPPQALTYARSFDLLARGDVLVPNTPTVSGGPATSFFITPALPTGMALDPQSGAITGTAATLAPLARYTVRAENSAGFAETELELGVVAPAHLVVTASVADDTLSSYAIDVASNGLSPTGYSLPASGSKVPRAVAAHPTGRTVYVAHRATSTLSSYEVDPGSGRLREKSAVPTAGYDPNEIVMSPQGDVLYLISQNSVHVQTFSISPSGGLTSIGTLTLADGSWSGELSPDGRFLWVTNVTSNTVRALALDATTHVPTSIGAAVSTSTAPTDVEVSRDGRFLYVNCQLGNKVEVFAVDPTSGQPVRTQVETSGTQPVALALAPSGEFLYASSSADNTLRSFTVDRASGALTPLDVIPTGSRPSLMAFDTVGARLFVVASDTNELESFAVDRDTGALARLDSVRTREVPYGLAVVSSDEPAQPKAKFAYVSTVEAGEAAVFTIDPESGSLGEVFVPVPSAGQRQELAVHPSLSWLVASRVDQDRLDVMTIHPFTGNLSPHGSVVGTADEPAAIVFDPSGLRVHVLCVAARQLQSFRFDDQLGTITPLASASVPAGCDSLAIDPTGRFLFVGNSAHDRVEVFASSLQNGTVTPLSGVTFSGRPNALSALPNGRYLAVTAESTGEVGLFSIAAQDGALVPLLTRVAGTRPVDVTSDSSGRFVYVSSHDTASRGDVSVFRVEPNGLVTGFLTRVGTALAGVHPVAARVDRSGSFLYVANAGTKDLTRFDIDRSSGLLSGAASTPLSATPRRLTLGATLR